MENLKCRSGDATLQPQLGPWDRSPPSQLGVREPSLGSARLTRLGGAAGPAPGPPPGATGSGRAAEGSQPQPRPCRAPPLGRPSFPSGRALAAAGRGGYAGAEPGPRGPPRSAAVPEGRNLGRHLAYSFPEAVPSARTAWRSRGGVSPVRVPRGQAREAARHEARVCLTHPTEDSAPRWCPARAGVSEARLLLRKELPWLGCGACSREGWRGAEAASAAAPLPSGAWGQMPNCTQPFTQQGGFNRVRGR